MAELADSSVEIGQSGFGGRRFPCAIAPIPEVEHEVFGLPHFLFEAAAALGFHSETSERLCFPREVFRVPERRRRRRRYVHSGHNRTWTAPGLPLEKRVE